MLRVFGTVEINRYRIPQGHLPVICNMTQSNMCSTIWIRQMSQQAEQRKRQSEFGSEERVD